MQFFRFFNFEFIPDGRDVGKRVVVEAFVVSIGRPDSSNIELEMNVKVGGGNESGGDDEMDEMTSQFFAPKVFKNDLEVKIVSTNRFSKIEIEPRSPNLKMELRYKGL